MDRSEYLREIKENIEYPFLCQQFNADDVDEVVGLMADVMCSTRPKRTNQRVFLFVGHWFTSVFKIYVEKCVSI